VSRPRKKDRHLPPCVYFQHGTHWYVKRKLWTDIGANLADALEAYARIVGTPQGNCDALIDEAFAFIRPRLSKATGAQYSQAAKKLKKALAQFRPEQVKPKHAAAIKKALAGKPNMGNRVLSFARQVFDYGLEQWPAVESNPFLGIKRHKERKRDRLITQDEYERIYAKAGPRLQIIMDLLIRTGQRITAVLRIRRSDLTAEGIRFPRHKTDSKGVLAWTPELREVVDRALAMHGKIERMTLLFNRKNKAPDYRSVKDQWDVAVAAAGVTDAHIHDLRAVAGTEAEEQGLNPQALLMHASRANTERYLRSKREKVVQGPSFRQSVRRAENKS
jgi:integrase